MFKSFSLLIIAQLLLSTVVWTQKSKADSVFIALYIEKALTAPDSSALYIQQARMIAKSENLGHQFDYSLARYYFMTGKLDSASIINQKAITQLKKKNASYWLMRHYVLSASISSIKKDYQTAISQFTEAQKIGIFIKDTNTVASIMSNIGNTYFGIKDHTSAHKYLNEAIRLFKTQEDTVHTSTIMAVNALALLHLSKPTEAEKMANDALVLAQKYKNFQAILIVHHCFGELERTRKNYAKAHQYFSSSLTMAQKANLAHYVLLNSNGLHATLTDEGKCEEAIIKGIETLNQAALQSNLDITTIIKRNLATCYAKMQNFEKAYQYFNESFTLYDSTSNLENKREIAGLLSQINLEQKDKELLSANVKILEQNNKIQKRNSFIYGLIGLASILGLAFYYNRKISQVKLLKLSLAKEKEILLSEMKGEELERKRISQELHDGVAGSIVGIKAHLNNLGNNATFDVDALSKMLTAVHQEVRQISHNLLPLELAETPLSQAIYNYLHQYQNDKLSIHFNGNLYDEHTLIITTKRALYRVCQEAIQNIIKHANATDIYVNMFSDDQNHTIMIEDNGTGFDPKIVHKTQGMVTMNDRIAGLGGTIDIDSRPGEGSIVNISILR